jgi:mono/diheme cytochrome c family protein
MAACQSPEDTKRDQFVAEGYTLYQTHCANCHQVDGKGLSGLYPAIVASYVEDQKTLARTIKYGMNQSIVVNNKTFARPMPGNALLKDLEIAEIITYLGHQYGTSKIYTPTDSVTHWVDKLP